MAQSEGVRLQAFPMETAPLDRYVMVWNGARWHVCKAVYHAYDQHLAWSVADAGDGEHAILANPLLWAECPLPPAGH